MDAIDQALARQDARRAARRAGERVERALKVWESAQDYPQCGQQWPLGAAQVAAAKVLATAKIVLS